MQKKVRQLLSIYYDVKGTGEIRPLAKTSNVKTKQVKAWLNSQEKGLHKTIHCKFPQKIIVGGPNQQWQVDFVDVSMLSWQNQGMQFLLTYIDKFSEKGWIVPLKDKIGTSLVNNFESIHHYLPQNLQTVKGM